LFVRHPGRQIKSESLAEATLFKLEFFHVPCDEPIKVDPSKLRIKDRGIGLAIWVIGEWI
jgi:hypothetical protein